MKNLADMYSLSSKLWFDKRWISKSGEVSLYLQVLINGKHKEFPLKLKWPADLIDLANGELLPRRKRDPDVDDYNLLIKMEESKHTEILRTYRIKKAPIDIQTFAREVRVFDNRESFVAYMYKQSLFRYQTKEISKRTYMNHTSAIQQMLMLDKAWPFDMITVKWMKRFKRCLQGVSGTISLGSDRHDGALLTVKLQDLSYLAHVDVWVSHCLSVVYRPPQVLAALQHLLQHQGGHLSPESAGQTPAERVVSYFRIGMVRYIRISTTPKIEKLWFFQPFFAVRPGLFWWAKLDEHSCQNQYCGLNTAIGKKSCRLAIQLYDE